MNSIWNKEALSEEWEGCIIAHIYKKGDKKTVVIIEAYHFCQVLSKFYPTSCCQGSFHMQRKLLGIITADSIQICY
jgi:hypothetical protein